MILCVSRFVREKGLENLILAFAELRKRHKDWTLRIVGPIVDAAYRSELELLISRLGLEDSVFVIPDATEEELQKEYLIATLFCLPSLKESFGSARVEAAANGLPVITTDVPCEIDLHRSGYLIVPPGSISALERGLEELITQPTLRESRLARQAAGIRTYEQLTLEFLATLSDPHSKGS